MRNDGRAGRNGRNDDSAVARTCETEEGGCKAQAARRVVNLIDAFKRVRAAGERRAIIINPRSMFPLLLAKRPKDCGPRLRVFVAVFTSYLDIDRSKRAFLEQVLTFSTPDQIPGG